jgi:hypothetical protein
LAAAFGAVLAMTDKIWKAEVADALAATGLPWRVTAAWVEQGSSMCGADLTDTRTGKEQRIRLSVTQFPSPSDRRAEIRRQLPGQHV